jgi:hypothetical protein
MESTPVIVPREGQCSLAAMLFLTSVIAIFSLLVTIGAPSSAAQEPVRSVPT